MLDGIENTLPVTGAPTYASTTTSSHSVAQSFGEPVTYVLPAIHGTRESNSISRAVSANEHPSSSTEQAGGSSGSVSETRLLAPLGPEQLSLEQLQAILTQRMSRAYKAMDEAAAEGRGTGVFADGDRCVALQRLLEALELEAMHPRPWAPAILELRLRVAIHRLDLLMGLQEPEAPVEPVPAGAVLTPLQAASLAAWQHGLPAHDAATAVQLRGNQSRTLTELGKHDSALPPPDANDPADLLRTAPSTIKPLRETDCPALIGCESNPLHRPVTDGAAIMRLAKEAGCPNCTASPTLPCYHPALAVNVDQHELPFSSTPTTPHIQTEADLYKFDHDTWSVIQGHVDEAVNEGAVQFVGENPNPDEAYIYSNVFLVRTFDMKLTAEQKVELQNANSIVAVAAIAMSLAAAFMASYVPQALAAIAGHTGSQLAQLLAGIWDAVLLSLHIEKKSRLVINLRPTVNAKLQNWPFKYASIADFLLHIRPGGFLAKTDVKAGFHHIRISPAHWKYLAFRTKKGVYRYLRLPFGLKTAPALFSWLTAEVNQLLRQQGVRASMVYIDDFLVYADTEAECRIALSLLERLCEALSIRLDPKKTEGPTQRLTILGLILDTSAIRISLPPEKLLKTLFYLFVFSGCMDARIPVPVGPVRKAAGALARLGIVNPDARPHLRGFAAAQGARHSAAPSTALVSFHDQPILRSNIAWLVNAVKDNLLNGERLLATPATARWNIVHITSDASKSADGVCGTGVRFATAAAAVPLPATFRDLHIGALELLPLCIFLSTVGDLLVGAMLFIGIDNEGDAFSINSARSKSNVTGLFVSLLYSLRRLFEFEFVATWLTRWCNYLADRLAICRTPAEARTVSPTAVCLPVGAQGYEQLGPPAGCKAIIDAVRRR